MKSFREWLADRNRQLDKQARAIEKPVRDKEPKISPWHQQKKMKN